MTAAPNAPLRMTKSTRVVLSALLNIDAEGRETYGFALTRGTGLQSGTLSPILERLHRLGWVADRRESAHEYCGIARPPRRYWRLTELGREQARAALQRFTSAAEDPFRETAAMSLIASWARTHYTAALDEDNLLAAKNARVICFIAAYGCVPLREDGTYDDRYLEFDRQLHEAARERLEAVRATSSTTY